MATPILDNISKNLSFKIFDPVNSGTSDGKVFSAELRLGYINRAYTNLVRLVETFEVDKTKVFKDYYNIIDEGSLTSSEIPFPTAFEPHDLFYAEIELGPQIRADYIEPENFLPAKAGLNAHYAPDEDNRYWSTIDGVIKLIPEYEVGTIEYKDVTILARNAFTGFLQGGSEDIKLPGEYESMLVIMAAMEAMSDKGDTGKYSLYSNSLDRTIQILGLKKTKQDSIAEEGNI